MPAFWDLAAVIAKFLLYLGVLGGAGTVFAALLFKATGIRTLALLFAIIGVLSALLGFALNGVALTGDASGMADPEMLGLLWSTPVGTALSFRLAGLILLIAGLFFGRGWLWISAAGGVLALWSFAVIGHVPGREKQWLNAVLLAHLVTVAMWIGILAPLRRLAQSSDLPRTADLGHRFGRLALIFVPLLVLAGLVMSYVLVGSISALIATSYGQALVLKVLAVAALLALAAVNKLRLVPQLMAGDGSAAHHLVRSITWEWVVFAVILLTTATLTSTLNLPT